MVNMSVKSKSARSITADDEAFHQCRVSILFRSLSIFRNITVCSISSFAHNFFSRSMANKQFYAMHEAYTAPQDLA